MPEREFQEKHSTESPDSPWRDRKGIAARYGVCVSTVKNWTRGRVLPRVKKGRTVLYHIHDCDRALKAFEVKSVAFSE